MHDRMATTATKWVGWLEVPPPGVAVNDPDRQFQKKARVSASRHAIA